MTTPTRTRDIPRRDTTRSGADRGGRRVVDRPTHDDIAGLAAQLRVRSVQMAERAGSGHPTSAMSAADLIATLVANHLRIDPERPDEPGNDRLIFSKGHASPLLYAAWESIGVLDGDLGEFDDVVDAYRQCGSILEGHPTPRVPGVSAATGSLGLGLGIGVGLATSNRLASIDDAHVWVLCGDGELAEGAIWEAAEHAGSEPVHGLTVIVDANRLGQTGPTRYGWDLDPHLDHFRSCGWEVFAIDGHDLDEIDHALETARRTVGPTAIIARTVKGRGVSEVADEPGKHGKPLDDPDRAVYELGGTDGFVRIVPVPAELRSRPDASAAGEVDLPRWEVGEELATRDAFGATMRRLGRARSDLVGLDGEVMNSTRMAEFADEFPDRFVECFIAEQLMSSMAIGLDAGGWRPVMASFAAFLTRAHDVLRMASIGRSSMVVVGSHAGVSIGEDGPSQMGLEDLAMMRSIAGSTVVSPSDANQTASLMAQLIDLPGVSYLRTMRQDTRVLHPAGDFPVGGSVSARSADDPAAVVIATGTTVHEALAAADALAGGGIEVEVLDAYSVKPIDRDAVARSAETGRLVVVEDHRREGGLGEAVAAVLAEVGAPVRMRHLAVDGIPGSATPTEQRAEAGIDAEAIRSAVTSLVTA